jgi:hypothetical protein
MGAAERALAVVLVAAAAWPVTAQNTDPLRAPRILNPPAGTAPAPQRPLEQSELRVSLPSVGSGQRPPNAARLAPLPGERGDQPEEIVVIGQGWRLPDLGSEWRARQKEADREARISATFLPLYDPAKPPLHSDVFSAPEQRRHGYIELFRLRFGRRSTD